MSMFYTNATQAGREQVAHRTQQRLYHNRQEAQLRAVGGLTVNADIDPTAWRELDTQIVQMMGQDADPIYTDLLPLAQSVSIGKFAHVYRQAGGMDRGETSLTGQSTHLMGQVSFDSAGILVPVHTKAFGRGWREVEAARSIGVDELAEDQAAAARVVRDLQMVNMMDGNPTLNFQGYQAYGLRTNPATQAITLLVNMTSGASTFAQMDAEFGRVLGVMRGGVNRVVRNFNVYISPEIEANWRRRSGDGTSALTFLQMFAASAGVASIQVSNQLTGNQMCGFVASREYIRPVVGQAIGTVPVPRLRPFDDFQFITWAASGLQIIQDAQGRSGVFYAAS